MLVCPVPRIHFTLPYMNVSNLNVDPKLYIGGKIIICLSLSLSIYIHISLYMFIHISLYIYLSLYYTCTLLVDSLETNVLYVLFVFAGQDQIGER